MTPELLTAFGQFGPLGLMIAYLIWREKTGAEKRGELERDRIESDRALTTALTALTVTIQHLERSQQK